MSFENNTEEFTHYIITGAAGHLAKNIIEILSQNPINRIHGLILPFEKGEQKDNVTYVKGDITDKEGMDAFFRQYATPSTVVIHTAGLISIESGVSDKLYSVNVQGTRNVLEASKKYSVKRFVYLSSVDALGVKKGSEMTEDDAYYNKDKVRGGYAKTKAESSRMVLDAATPSFETIVILPSCILGPGDTGTNHLNQFVKALLKHMVPVSIEGGFDFVDVRDVAKGCILAANKGKSGESYILSSSYYTVDDLEEAVRKESGGIKKITLPMKFVKACVPLCTLWSKISGKRSLVTKYSLETLEEGVRYSHKKADEELGYTVRPLSETVHDMNMCLKKEREMKKKSKNT
ncbi:MAG: NAD-dependent epimerase/dehydratase family protein [Sphaerochaetaceae bacterium]|nr:NAD-dependent epimerase/dehydratase family protein [Sphaerochaetaceae bacterium]